MIDRHDLVVFTAGFVSWNVLQIGRTLFARWRQKRWRVAQTKIVDACAHEMAEEGCEEASGWAMCPKCNGIRQPGKGWEPSMFPVSRR